MVIQSPLPPIKEPQVGLIQFLFANTNNTPEDRKMLIDASTGKSLTLRELKDAVLRFAAGLQDKYNFKKGDTVAIYAPNQYDYSVPFFGIIAAGGAASPANPSYTARELVYQMEAIKAKILLTHESNINTALEAAQQVGLPKSNILLFGDKAIDGVLTYKQVLLGSRHVVLQDLTPEETKDAVACLCFSSGTTGKSKGVMTTHANMAANILQYCMLEGKFVSGNHDRMLATIPFYHIMGLSLMLHVALYLGIPVHVMSKFDLSQFCETIQRKKITFTIIAPPIVVLLAKSPAIDNYDLSSLRLVICGAAPLSGDLSKQVRQRLPKIKIKQGYGLTETSPCAIIEPTDRIIDGSVGVLLSNMTARIVDDNGKDVPAGERGELWLKGPNVMKGYINNPEATAECIDSEGYFHTGDIAIQDKNGHFFIVDRIKELIKFKGFQVPPAELEALLLKSPIVADCGVVGVYNDELATEVPRGYVVLKPGVPATEQTANEIKKYIAGTVAYYKQLHSIVFVNEIPKNPSGKILRRILRDAAATEAKSKAKL
ncbi:hypothetical protein RMCBS344292_17043 [Rhizopus microsporus]|nr:hypothetical protein RMCBS344292_17043 [Rhizopus microsporus]